MSQKVKKNIGVQQGDADRCSKNNKIKNYYFQPTSVNLRETKHCSSLTPGTKASDSKGTHQQHRAQQKKVKVKLHFKKNKTNNIKLNHQFEETNYLGCLKLFRYIHRHLNL